VWPYSGHLTLNRSKCASCGLINFAADAACRRCGAALIPEEIAEPEGADQPSPKRSIRSRIVGVCSATAVILFIAYMSLLLSSSELRYERRDAVRRATAVLEQRGFSRQAFVLNHLVMFRDTDNWWNRSVGHHSAYAATNFPFEVVTLYPEFFDTAVDDTERASILLHESYHLLGSGEAAALEGVWRDKQKLGWTADKYARTKVWNNTKELTAATVPKLFACGPDGRSECIQQ
jgi:hypothetical protein